MISLNLEIPATDLVDMQKKTAAYVAYHKGNSEKAVQRIAVKLALALRASTKGTRQAPKRRPVVKNPLYTSGKSKGDGLSKRDRMKEHISDYYSVDRKRPDLDLVSFKDESLRFKAKKAIHRIRHGKKILMPVYDNAKKVAVNSPLRAIKKRGLADASWFWMLGKLGKKSGAPPGVGVTAKNQSGVTQTSNIKTTTETSVTLVNKLNYIRSAFFTSGSTAISSAISRTAKMMQYEMDKVLRDAAKDSGLSKAG